LSTFLRNQSDLLAKEEGEQKGRDKDEQVPAAKESHPVETKENVAATRTWIVLEAPSGKPDTKEDQTKTVCGGRGSHFFLAPISTAWH